MIEDERKNFASCKDFKINKALRAASGDTIAVEFKISLIRLEDEKQVEIYGAEFWKMRNNRLIEWKLYTADYTDE